MTLRDRIVKRTFDLCLAAIGLVFLWPLIVVCILVAAVDTKSLGVFRQLRVGLRGVPFHVLKIRSMYKSEDLDATTITTAHDNRITPTGRVLRRLKLDELPQLWNVLIGQMSFVGPRPDVPGYADKLIGQQRKILDVRPGITGPATIKYSKEDEILSAAADPVVFNDTVVFPDKIRLNVEYVENYSFLDDLTYILITLRLLKVPAHLSYSKDTGQ